MTVMCPERVVSPIVQLVTQSSLKNASRFARIIRVEKVTLQLNFQFFCNNLLNSTATNSGTWNGKNGPLKRAFKYKPCGRSC